MKVNTTQGELDDSELEKKTGPGWVEYWKDGECVHRSATVNAAGVKADGKAADLPAGKALRG